MENKQFFKGLNKSLKTVVCSAVALAITTYMTSDVQAASFNDTLGHWAENQIDRWAGEGVLEGFNGYYRPNDPITRAEMAVILNKIMDYQIESTTYYSDLGGSEWYTSYVRKLNSAGFMEGADGKIRPYDNITREEAAVVIANAFHYDVPSTTSGVINTVFTDNTDIAYWAKNSVNVLYQNGVISGRGGNYFDPKSNVTRAEVAQMLDNIVSTFVHERQDVTNTVINGNMVINEPGTTLTNVTINGNLILAEGIADGDIDLTNVTVTGNIIIKGGSTGTIYVEDVTIQGRLEVSRVDAPTLVTIRGKSNIPVIDIYHNCVVDATELDDEYSLGDVTIYGKDNVTILGKVDSIVNKSPNLNLTVSGTIGSIYMESNGTVNGDNYGAGSYVDTTKIPGTSATGAPYIYATSNFPSSGSATIVVDEPTFDEDTGEVKVFVYVSSIKNCAIMSEPQNAITLPEGSKISSIDVEMTKDGEDTFGTYVYEVTFTVTGSVSTVELDVNFKTDSGAPDVTLVKNFEDVTSGEGTASANITDTVVDDETGEVTVTIIVSNMVNCRLPGSPSKAVTVAVPEGEDEEDYPSIISVVEGAGSTSTITAYEVTFLPNGTQDTFPLQVNFLDGSDDSDYSKMAVNLTQVFPAYDEEEDKATAVTTVSTAIDDEDNELTYFYIYVSEMVNCTLPTDLEEAVTLKDDEDDTELTITLVSSGTDARTYKVTVPYDEDRTELDLYLNYITASNVDSVSVSVVTNPEIEDANLTFARWESEEGSNTIKGVIVASAIEGYNLKASSDATAIVSVADEDTVTDFDVDFYVGNNNIFEVSITPADDIEEVVLVVEYEATSAVEEGAPTITSSTYYNNVVDASVATVRTEITRYVASTGATTMTVSVPAVSATAQLVAGLTNAFKLSDVTNFAIVDNEDSTYTVTFNTAEADAALNLNVYFETFSYSEGTYKLYTRAGGGSINCYLIPSGTSVGSTSGSDVESNSVVAIRANVSDGRYYVVPTLTSDSTVTLQPNHSFVMPDSDVTVTAITYTLPSDAIKYTWSAAYATGSINTVYNGSFGLVDVETGENAYYMEAGKEYDLHCFVPDGYSFVGYRYGGEDITGNRITATADKTAFTVIVVRGTSYAVTKDASSEDFTLLSGSTTVATPATIMENTQLQIVADGDKTEKVEFSTDGGSTWTEIVYNNGYFHTVTGATSFKVTYKDEVPTEDVFSDITNDDDRVGITVDADDVDDDDNVKAGASVTVTITPEEGKVVDTVKVKDSDGDDISTDVGLTGPNAEGDYTFTMPSFDCEVDVTYKDAAVEEEDEEEEEEAEDTYTLGKHDSNNDFTITDADGTEVSSVVGTTTVTIVPDSSKTVDKVYYFQATEDNEWKELVANADGSYTFEVSADTRFQVTYAGEPESFELYYYDKVLISGVEDVQTLTYTKDADTGNIQVVATLPSDWEKDKYELRTTNPLVIDTDPPTDTGVTTTIVTDPVLNETTGTVTFTVNVDATTLLTDVTVTFNLYFTEVSEEGTPLVESAITVTEKESDGTDTAPSYVTISAEENLDLTKVEENTLFTVNVARDGYEATVEVTSNGTELQPVISGSTLYRMPDSDVTITVTYTKLTGDFYTITKSYTPDNINGFALVYLATDSDKNSVTSGESGKDYAVEVLPVTGYTVSGVTVTGSQGDDVTVTGATYSFTMPDDSVTVTVDYTKEDPTLTKGGNNYVITLNDGNDTVVTDATSVATGTTVTISRPTEETRLIESIVYYVGGTQTTVAVTGGGTGGTFTMPEESCTVYVTYVSDDTTAYTITKASGSDGFTVTIDGGTAQSIDSGIPLTGNKFVTIVPETGRTVKEVTVNGTSCGTTLTHVVDSATAFSVVYEEQFTVTIKAPTEGSLSVLNTTTNTAVATDGKMEAGMSFTVSTANVANKVATVTVTHTGGNNVEVEPNEFGIYTMPSSDVSISVSYADAPSDSTEYSVVVLDSGVNYGDALGGTATNVPTTGVAGTEITVTPDVKTDYQVASITYSVDGGATQVAVSLNNDGTWKFNIPSGITSGNEVQITVNFAEIRTIKASATIADSTDTTQTTAPEISVKGSTATTGIEGDEVGIAIHELTGYAVESVTVTETDGTNTVTPTMNTSYNYTFMMPDYDVDIVVTYKLVGTTQALIKDTNNGNSNFTVTAGSATVTGNSQVSVNETVTVTMPSSNAGIVYLNGQASDRIESGGTYSFTMPAYEATISVKYYYSISKTPTDATFSVTDGVNDVEELLEGSTFQVSDSDNTLASVTATYGTNEVLANQSQSGGYAYTMPQSNVVVSATYTNDLTAESNLDTSSVKMVTFEDDGTTITTAEENDSVQVRIVNKSNDGLSPVLTVYKVDGMTLTDVTADLVIGSGHSYYFIMPNYPVHAVVTYTATLEKEVLTSDNEIISLNMYTITGEDGTVYTDDSAVPVGETITVNPFDTNGDLPSGYSTYTIVVTDKDDAPIRSVDVAETQYVIPESGPVTVTVTYIAHGGEELSTISTVKVELLDVDGTDVNLTASPAAQKDDAKETNGFTIDSTTGEIKIHLKNVPADYNYYEVTAIDGTSNAVVVASGSYYDRANDTLVFYLGQNLETGKNVLDFTISFEKRVLTIADVTGSWNSKGTNYGAINVLSVEVDNTDSNQYEIVAYLPHQAMDTYVLNPDSPISFGTDTTVTLEQTGSDDYELTQYLSTGYNQVKFTVTIEPETTKIDFDVNFGYELSATIAHDGSSDVVEGKYWLTATAGDSDKKELTVLESTPQFLEVGDYIEFSANATGNNTSTGYKPVVTRTMNNGTPETLVGTWISAGTTWSYQPYTVINGVGHIELVFDVESTTTEFVNNGIVGTVTAVETTVPTNVLDTFTVGSILRTDATGDVTITFTPPTITKGGKEYQFDPTPAGFVVGDIASLNFGTAPITADSVEDNGDGSYSITVEAANLTGVDLATVGTLTFQVNYKEVAYNAITQSLPNSTSGNLATIAYYNGDATTAMTAAELSSVPSGTVIRAVVTNSTSDYTNFENYNSTDGEKYFTFYDSTDNSSVAQADISFSITKDATSGLAGATFEFGFTMPAYPLNVVISTIS